ncbi:MAG: hypothetical protein A2020_09805 [Lentisphaerae bacterium GWF2_45_14]|nr:MAG: hypothetical protein A2020_09805 [Lentisphaerae bacterium GWF2_45_14]
MKQGDSIDCPLCGKNSFLKKVPVLDGWTKKGDILACAACSGKIADLPPVGLAGNTGVQKGKSVSALESLLGEKHSATPRIEAAEDEKSFCRDCKSYIVHPFMNRCGRHNKDVNPMSDCPDFIKK